MKGLSHTFVLSIDGPNETRHFDVKAILFLSFYSYHYAKGDEKGTMKWWLLFEKPQIDIISFRYLELTGGLPQESYYLELNNVGQGGKGATTLVARLLNRTEGLGSNMIEENEVLVDFVEHESSVRGYGNFGTPIGQRRFLYTESSGKILV